MFALTNILSLAEPDPPESRNTDIEMTASQFAAAHWVAEFLARRTIDRKLRLQPRARRVSSAIPSLMKRWRPLNGARPGISSEETIGGPHGAITALDWVRRNTELVRHGWRRGRRYARCAFLGSERN